MKLTKTLKAVILRQFKDGASVEYLAKLYQISMFRVENVIRMWLIEQDERTNKV